MLSSTVRLVVEMNVLVIAAHPDDEVLGAGCAMAAHAQKGDSVFVYIATDGCGARKEKGYDAKRAQELRQHAEKSAKLLGVKKVFFGEFEDQMLDVTAISHISKALEKVLLETKPQVVYTHSSADMNKDHRILFEATMIACRPHSSSGATVKKVLSFEILSSTEWGTQALKTSFLPNYFVDASKGLLGKKTLAFACYATEGRPDPHPRSKRGIEVLAAYRGFQAGVEHAEAFEVIREMV